MTDSEIDTAVAALRELILAGERYRLVVAHHLGVTVSESQALSYLLARGPMGQTDLGNALHFTTGSTTSLVDRLERRGFVERVSDPQDRRRNTVQAIRARPQGHRRGKQLDVPRLQRHRPRTSAQPGRVSPHAGRRSTSASPEDADPHGSTHQTAPNTLRPSDRRQPGEGHRPVGGELSWQVPFATEAEIRPPNRRGQRSTPLSSVAVPPASIERQGRPGSSRAEPDLVGPARVNNSQSGALCEEPGSDACGSVGAMGERRRRTITAPRRREHEGAPIDGGQPVRPYFVGHRQRELDVHDEGCHRANRRGPAAKTPGWITAPTAVYVVGVQVRVDSFTVA